MHGQRNVTPCGGISSVAVNRGLCVYVCVCVFKTRSHITFQIATQVH